MPLQFYKPQANGQGHACNFKFNSKDAAIYMGIVKQTGWNATEKTGTFQEGEKINVKFSEIEAGDLLCLLERGVEKSGFHTFGDSKLSFSFKKWVVDQGGTKILKGYGISVQKPNGSGETTQFRIGFSHGEGVVLREFLRNAMRHFNDARYSADKAAYEAATGKKTVAKKTTPAPKKAVATPESSPSIDEDPFASTPETIPAQEKVENSASEPDNGVSGESVF